MKQLKHILLLVIFVAGAATGCQDFVMHPKYSQQTLKDYFSTPETASQFVNGMYASVLYNTWWRINFFNQLNSAATGIAWLGNIAQMSQQYLQFASFQVQPTNSRLATYFKYNYEAITRANIAIEKMPEVDFDNEYLQKRLVAEAKFLRSYFYLRLAWNFAVPDERAIDGRGGVPIVDSYSEILDPKIYKYRRATRDSLYEFITKNLREAAKVLPKRSQYAKSDYGRATRGAALTLLGKAYMTLHKFQKAQNVLNKVIKSGEYQLNPNFLDIWSVNNNANPGTIFAVLHKNSTTYKLGGVRGVTTQSRNDPFNGWSWCVPSSWLERKYKSEGDSIRLHATIMKEGQPVYDKHGNMIIRNFDAGDPDENKSGRIWRKYYVPVEKRKQPYGRGQIRRDQIILRLGDVLLMHALASWRVGDETAALRSLKKVRSRVGLKTDMTLSGVALRNAIWKERAMEMAGEFHRLNVLRRQMKNGKSRLAYLMGPGGKVVKYNTKISNDKFETNRLGIELQEQGILFEYPKDLVWPLPSTVVQRSGGRIKQNPGY